jgi:hypothetical protein
MIINQATHEMKGGTLYDFIGGGARAANNFLSSRDYFGELEKMSDK